jgi:hypothetical protein
MTRGVVVALAMLAIPVATSAQLRCSQETLTVRGAPVTVSYCVGGSIRSTDATELIVPVAATYSAPGGTVRRSVNLRFVAGERTSRIIENLDLRQLGLAGTLHLTLAYAGGLVRVEEAMLTPGAITIK